MIRVDKGKIYASSDVIKDINLSEFGKTTNVDKRGNSQIIWTNSQTNIPGLKYIAYKEAKEQLIIDFTSKILLDDYYDMISIDTVEQFFDKINKTGIVEIDKSKIDQFSTYSLDITQNIDSHLIGNDLTPGKVINACAMISNDKFQPEPYKGKKEDKYRTGIVYKTKLKENNERLIIYDKETEVNKSNKGDKVSKLFWDSVTRPLILRNKFQSIVRPEMNITSKYRMREYIKTDNFIQILQSNEQPLYRQFGKIKRYDYKQLDIFNYPEELPFNRLIFMYGAKNFIRDLHGDINLIRDVIRKHVKGNISNYVKTWSQYVTDFLNEDDNKVYISKEIIEHFHEQLKKAI